MRMSWGLFNGSAPTPVASGWFMVDGACCWRQFVHVTLPGLRPTILFTIVVDHRRHPALRRAPALPQRQGRRRHRRAVPDAGRPFLRVSTTAYRILLQIPFTFNARGLGLRGSGWTASESDRHVEIASEVIGNRHRSSQRDRVRNDSFISNSIGILESEFLNHMDLITVHGTVSIPPSGHLISCLDSQNVPFKLSDRVALIQLYTGGKVFPIRVEIDHPRCASRIPSKNNRVFVLQSLEAHLNAEVGRHASWKAMGVRLVEHMVLGFIRSLGFPLGVIRDLAVSRARFRVKDATSTTVDVGLGCGRPISREVGVAIRSADYGTCGNCWGTAAPTATPAAADHPPPGAPPGA